jgi:hypothetical protein
MAEGEASGEPVHPAEPDAAAKAAAKDEIKKVLETDAVRESEGLPESLRYLKEQNEALEIELKRRFAEQEYDLKKTYAHSIIRLLGLQMLVANAVFVTFAWAGEHWKLETAVIDVWLGATVVQVVGIALVVTRHLFPQRDKPDQSAAPPPG